MGFLHGVGPGGVGALPGLPMFDYSTLVYTKRSIAVANTGNAELGSARALPLLVGAGSFKGGGGTFDAS
jgi:hypothetical protein